MKHMKRWTEASVRHRYREWNVQKLHVTRALDLNHGRCPDRRFVLTDCVGSADQSLQCLKMNQTMLNFHCMDD